MTQPPSASMPRWSKTFLSVLERAETGAIVAVFPDGRDFRIDSGQPGPQAVLQIANSGFFARLVRDGELGFGEMFMDGWWYSPDLQELMDFLLVNNEAVSRQFPGAGLVRQYERLRHVLRRNSLRGARRNITCHYDLGNDFYKLWLDDSMTYSSALFSSEDESLSQAQHKKYAALCDRIGLKPGQSLLEIGCGWGGFAEYAIRERGAEVTGLTLSRAQQDFARRRLFEAGLSERADILLRDYRHETGRYDHVASIEMFEAVGERYWPIYFRTLRNCLRYGGCAGLQVITIADRLFPTYRRSRDFIQKHVFPGGLLPSRPVLQSCASRAGLSISSSDSFAASYSRTLREWRTAFNSRQAEISALGFDARFRRMWDFYLAASAACFAAGTTNVEQVVFRHSS